MRNELSQIELARLRTSLNAKLATEAKRRGVTADLVRKQYIFTIFLSRVFQDHESQWVLLGGNALLIRTGGGRFTQDIDLARESPWLSVESARAELEQLAARPFADDDPFDFILPSAETHSEPDQFGYGAETGKIKARALLGNTDFETFSIDITARRHVDSAIDHVPLRAVIEHATLQSLPAVPTTPIENHLADKICALYERHGRESENASTRYRDLADIVRIVAAVSFDASRLSVVLEREAGRRRMTLPTKLASPGGAWPTEFPKAAARFAEYPTEYHELDSALQFAGNCLDEVLAGERSSGRWEPDRQWV